MANITRYPCIHLVIVSIYNIIIIQLKITFSNVIYVYIYIYIGIRLLGM